MELGLVEMLASKGLGDLAQLEKSVDLVKKMFHTESSTKISERKSQMGFKILNSEVRHKVCTTRPGRFDSFIRKEIEILKNYTNGNSRYNQIIEEIFNSGEDEEENTEHRQSIQFNVQGKIFFIQVQWIPLTNDRYKYRNVILAAEFSLMPDYCIITRSKKGFFSSSSHDEICYIDRGVTEQDIATVFNVCFLPLTMEANRVPLLDQTHQIGN